MKQGLGARAHFHLLSANAPIVAAPVSVSLGLTALWWWDFDSNRGSVCETDYDDYLPPDRAQSEAHGKTPNAMERRYRPGGTGGNGVPA